MKSGALVVVTTVWLLLLENVFALGSGEVVLPDQPFAKSTVYIEWSSGVPCTGVLITQDLILTAGHCATNADDPYNWKTMLSSDFKIYFGNKVGLSSDPEPYRVKEVRRHPQYPDIDFKASKAYGDKDLAILQLDKPAPLNFVPAKILRDPSLIVKDMFLTLIGYGCTDSECNSHSKYPHILRSFGTLVDEPFSEERKLQLYRSRDLPWLKEKWLAGDEAQRKIIDDAGVQSGDSGGPAFVRINKQDFVAGITSGYNSDGTIPVYENVPVNAEWIINEAISLGSPLE